MRLAVFDGNSIISRSFYAIRPLTNKDGVHTNAIFGFLNVLLKFIETYKPDYLCVAFDLKAPTFRHELYDEYKAHRKPQPSELTEQIPLVKELLDSMGIKRLECEGYEADDIIGTIARLCDERKLECIIATGDKDDLQLVSENVKVALTVTKNGSPDTVLYEPQTVFERYEVTPDKLVEVKALMGDPSDNIPGVKGIGEKTAIELIKSFGTLENIYENINSEKIKDKVREKLIEDKETAFISRTLSEINKNVPIDTDFENFRYKGYKESEAKFYNYLKYLNFNSFISRLNLTENVPENETVKKEAESADTVKCSFSDIENKIKKELYFLFENERFFALIDGMIYEVDLSENQITLGMLSIFKDNSVKKYTHNAKPFLLYLINNGIEAEGLAFDTEIAAYTLNTRKPTYPLEELVSDYLEINSEDKVTALKYMPELIGKMNEKLKEENLGKLYFEIELPLIGVLASMEYYGFRIDQDELKKYQQYLDERLNKITADIYSITGEVFNINSPKQLGEVLFEKLMLPHAKKTKTGYSTDVSVLEKLKNAHPVIDMLLEYRQVMKLKTTYADGLLKVIAQDGKIHSSFNQTVTQTGRISSTEPNLQNIPVRQELGRELRKMFTASDGFTLLDADYSQIELRVLAHIADDEKMIDAFSQNEDIHTKTASEVFGLPPEFVTNLQRSRAKAVNFGIVYGIGEYSLSQDLGISIKEAKQYIDNYLATYSNVKKYMKEIVESAKENGFVITLYGRKRYIPELKSTNRNVRLFGERVALNTPIQGTAADIIKIAMIRVFNRLKNEDLKSRLILQVHDELIVETAKDEVDKVKVILKEEMQNAAMLKVPLLVDVNEGENWYKSKG